MLRSLIHLDLSFMHGNRYGSIFLLLHDDIQLCQHHLLNFFSFYIFCFFVKNQVFIGVWINIWVSDLVPLVLLFVLMPMPGCFQYCSSVVEFEVKDCDASRSSLLYRIVLAILRFLFFHMKLSTVLSRSVKNFARILMGVALNLWNAFGKIAIFTMLILLIHEQGRSFYHLIPYSISFLKFLSYRFLT